MQVGRRWACTAIVMLGVGAMGCEGPMGPEGPAGDPGNPGAPGGPGAPGEDGTDPRSPFVAGDQLQLEVTQASLTDGTATATFTVMDDDGRPLDIDGFFTPGSVSINFVLARLVEHSEGVVDGYYAYTTREQTSPITDVTATQPAADTGGSFEELEPGVYTYTFGTTVEPPDPSETHRIAVYATRAVDGVTAVANTVYDFIPDGEGDPLTWQVVSEGACNQCHGELAFHGGARRGLDVCVTCHTQDDAIDPDTGNSIAFEDMIHKIHMGADLPSVQAGIPYQIIGFRQSVHDYSTVGFPGFISNCATCHEGPDAEAHRQRPTAHACTSCHDTTVFSAPEEDWEVLHGGGTQPDDAMCAVCHPPVGSIAGITDVHLPPELDLENPQLALTLLDIQFTAPEETPQLLFRVEVDGAPRDILASPLNGLIVRVAGPNTDFTTQWQHNMLSTGTLAAENAAAGEFRYTFPSPMPADASGSYTVGLEGFLQPGGPPRLAAHNPVMAFAVTDPEPVPRRQVVETERCNACHTRLAFHQNMRLNPDYCAMCHNPGMVSSQLAPQVHQDVLLESLNFPLMIHKIHAGQDLAQGYVVGGRPPPDEGNPWGTQKDFGTVRYPRPLADCAACHTSTSYDVPLPMTHLPTRMAVRSCDDPAADPDDWCENVSVSDEWLIPPETAACTSCHDRPSTEAHANIMTTEDGRESCATCHGPGSAYAADRAHGMAP
jgi:OmcA/MtrC family decaheme c-type cytochrome